MTPTFAFTLPRHYSKPTARTTRPGAALADELTSANPRVRIDAAATMVSLNIDTPHAMETLDSALKDTSVEVRAGAADHLGELGPAAKDAVPLLTEALDDNDISVRISPPVR